MNIKRPLIVSSVIGLITGTIHYMQFGNIRSSVMTLFAVVAMLFSLSVIVWCGASCLETIWPQGFGRVDARGRRVRVSRVDWKNIQITSVEQMLLVLWMREHPQGRWRKPVWILFVVSWLVAWHFISKNVDTSGELGILRVFGICAPVFIIATRIQTHASLRYEVAALRAIGRCIACTYDLKPLLRQADGCKVCPECGAAWNSEPVHASA